MNMQIEPRGNVLSFLEAQMNQQRDQFTVMEQMFEAMKKSTERVELIEQRIVVLAAEVKDQIRLLPAELADLYDAVAARSIQQAKLHKDEEAEDFPKLVGKLRHKIWRELNRKCGVSRYIYIRRSDLAKAMEYASTFDLADHV